MERSARNSSAARMMSPQAPVGEWLDSFDDHLRRDRGVTAETRAQYRRYVREFLEASFSSSPVDLARLGAGDLIRYVSGRAKDCTPVTAKHVTTALRSFLRFGQLKGECSASLVDAVPTIPRWRLATLPLVLADGQVGELLAAFDRTTPIGKRDYAMAVCLADLGLRACEVARMTLDDLDWRDATVRMTSRKSPQASLLPLPARVGRAIVVYLRSGRPRTLSRRIFVRHLAPTGAPIDAGGVRSAIRRAFARAGVSAPSRGTHALRHTLATRLLRAGASIKEVADVLRHRSIDTTAIYAKVDLPRLVEVALPWPEVRP